MIKVMRKHAKYFYFLFFIVILSFVFWGMGGVDDTGQSEVLAEVGEYKITTHEFWRSYDRASRIYREIYKDKFEEMMKQMNLKEQILDSMVDEHVLLISAQEMGIQVSDQELNDAIEYSKGNILLASESVESQMVRIAQNELHFGRYIPLREVLENIEVVCQDDILELANNLYQKEHLALTVLGPAVNNQELLDVLDL